MAIAFVIALAIVVAIAVAVAPAWPPNNINNDDDGGSSSENENEQSPLTPEMLQSCPWHDGCLAAWLDCLLACVPTANVVAAAAAGYVDGHGDFDSSLTQCEPSAFTSSM